ncbi:hypothetical protein CCP3SC15_880002 [Gammaproteobacteria bacterium]
MGGMGGMGGGGMGGMGGMGGGRHGRHGRDGGGGGGMGGMGGMGGGGMDAGLTKDQLNDINSSDSNSSSQVSDLVENFDAADTNQDGKVSFQETMAYEQSKQSAAADSGTTTNTGSSTVDSNTQVMSQIMRLMHAYGIGNESNSTATGMLSAMA